jgi:hypothetical protein
LSAATTTFPAPSAALPLPPPDSSAFHLRVRRWMRYRRELAGFLIDVLCELVSERATGRLTIDLTQGCAACATFEERSSL